MEQSYYKEFIKDVPNHPKNGILFRDIQPLLADARVFEDAINDIFLQFIVLKKNLSGMLHPFSISSRIAM